MLFCYWRERETEREGGGKKGRENIKEVNAPAVSVSEVEGVHSQLVKGPNQQFRETVKWPHPDAHNNLLTAGIPSKVKVLSLK